jgi:light-regulated signal transduction histidine kinase (bacteriophytochrome)
MFDPANKPDKERLENILYIIMQIASGNVDARAVISEGADDIDAISLGINMLGEEIKAMQEKLKAEINETKNAKEELENFSYAVSHNLRGPLRAIDGYSHILMSDYFEILNKTGQKNLDIIIRNTEKMEYLIDGLLAFTGYGKQTLNKVTINLNLLVKNFSSDNNFFNAGSKSRQSHDRRSMEATYFQCTKIFLRKNNS